MSLQHKLNADDARAIFLSNLSNAKLAAHYRVSTSVIRRIKEGLAWRHATDSIDRHYCASGRIVATADG